ncbi:hypothetical protein K505DRAFT_323954, partial [Melanomma pulvis-pyrius CBS 109.77]
MSISHSRSNSWIFALAFAFPSPSLSTYLTISSHCLQPPNVRKLDKEKQSKTSQRGTENGHKKNALQGPAGILA